MLEITNGVLKNNANATSIVADLEEQGLVEVHKKPSKGGRPRTEVRVTVN
jgi:DNA-binding PadR family transcriptional regulator